MSDPTLQVTDGMVKKEQNKESRQANSTQKKRKVSNDVDRQRGCINGPWSGERRAISLATKKSEIKTGCQRFTH